ncbi:1,4-dihydroxy-2-naphthoate octaprenyltransferase [Polaribacter huanghezhanensis]|uniref:1,4-dihydroxy-2-naphthoate octaprenyltransferase n=1 Tax=Polaribacter huanghezhanensis TaxID=1354726 RepID=UPI0026471B95|nr:1,4-dihydroxy-2-naphthoate octaprenyltransferase [Polaribacter huanghezhanensis]WKD84716.1 1,4-dihydroxy-2-naphthoate octaprenyltransferase [Polaribacter huanghezhanensis]
MIKKYIQAARLRTLPLSISGIIVGSFLGNNDSTFRISESLFNTTISIGAPPIYTSSIFWLAILTTIGFQVLSNFANDYGDGIKGADDNRTGEKRLVASGAISPTQMKSAMILTTMITLIVALTLIYVAFGKDDFGYSILFFLLGIASIAAAIKYTVGKSAYGYSGFGDVFVFVFFGLLSVVGSYFLFTKEINFIIFLPAFSIGLLSTAVLNLNNMRDWENDEKVSKNTLVVKIGIELAKQYHSVLIIASFLFAFLYVVIQYKNPMQFLFLIAYFPLIKHLLFVMKNTNEADLDGELKKVALSTFLFGILFGLGQVL